MSGSSPRGRGKRPTLSQLNSVTGLIPAWAGKTICREVLDLPAAAHPRVGGENDDAVCTADVMLGSSPRGRGKPSDSAKAATEARLIPAWAGKTLSDLRFYQADRSDLGNP